MHKRFSIYDVMEGRGDFAKNPANASAVDSVTGISVYTRLKFPKMVYHPRGEERVVRKGEPLATPMGVVMVGEQRELINKIIRDEKELNLAVKEGWHLSPTAAMKKAAELRGETLDRAESPLEAESLAKQDEISQLRKQLAEMEERNAALELGMVRAKPEAGALASAKK